MANLTLYNIAICAVVSLGGFSYGFGYAIIIILTGQAGFFEYFKLDRKIVSQTPSLPYNEGGVERMLI
jgi:hypothetical protein